MRTILQINNCCPYDLVISNITEIDSSDWDGIGTAYLKGTEIPAGGSIERKIEVNAWASNCPFTITFTVKNTARRIRQKQGGSNPITDAVELVEHVTPKFFGKIIDGLACAISPTPDILQDTNLQGVISSVEAYQGNDANAHYKNVITLRGEKP